MFPTQPSIETCSDRFNRHIFSSVQSCMLASSIINHAMLDIYRAVWCSKNLWIKDVTNACRKITSYLKNNNVKTRKRRSERPFYSNIYALKYANSTSKARLLNCLKASFECNFSSSLCYRKLQWNDVAKSLNNDNGVANERYCSNSFPLKSAVPRLCRFGRISNALPFYVVVDEMGN